MLREAIFLVPVSPPVRFEGGVFLNGRFVTNFGRLALSAALPCGFTFLTPVHFGDLELTGTKKRLSLVGRIAKMAKNFDVNNCGR